VVGVHDQEVHGIGADVKDTEAHSETLSPMVDERS
jgi:hypothetical protein